LSIDAGQQALLCIAWNAGLFIGLRTERERERERERVRERAATKEKKIAPVDHFSPAAA
jgi:hypothetical protein